MEDQIQQSNFLNSPQCKHSLGWGMLSIQVLYLVCPGFHAHSATEASKHLSAALEFTGGRTIWQKPTSQFKWAHSVKIQCLKAKTSDNARTRRNYGKGPCCKEGQMWKRLTVHRSLRERSPSRCVQCFTIIKGFSWYRQFFQLQVAAPCSCIRMPPWGSTAGQGNQHLWGWRCITTWWIIRELRSAARGCLLQKQATRSNLCALCGKPLTL